MSEVDDRLVGDPVWELFPQPTPVATRRGRVRDYWLIVAFGSAVLWLVEPALAVAAACVAAAAPDVRTGWRLARSMPDRAGGAVCSRFHYAWAAWKAGVTAFVMMFVAIILVLDTQNRPPQPPPAAFIVAVLTWMLGFVASAGWTAAGLVAAYRSGMRVWIGEGVNQARTLLMGMLTTGFVFLVIVPFFIWLGAVFTPGRQVEGFLPTTAFLGGLFFCMFGGPVLILVVLDLLSRRVVADRPGKFGPKVPTVGKWNA